MILLLRIALLIAKSCASILALRSSIRRREFQEKMHKLDVK